MFFDDYKHFDRFIEKNFSPSEIIRIKKHLTGTYETFKKGTFMIRVINLTYDEAQALIDLGVNLYFDVDEFVGDDKDEIQYEKFNAVHKYPMDYMQGIKHKVLKGLRDEALEKGTINSFMGLYGNVDSKYVLDVYVIDIESVIIILNYYLNIKSKTYNLK